MQVTSLSNKSVLLSQEFRSAKEEASRSFVGREDFMYLIALGAIAGEPILAIGPPGTGKSEIVRRFAQSLGATYFEYLIGITTKPEELFGQGNQLGRRIESRERRVAGLLLGAEVAFLDEVFSGSTAISNPLMGILFERIWRQKRIQIKCPLRICVAATSQLPQDLSSLAFAERFLLRIFIDPLPDHKLETLLEGGLWLGDWGVRKHSSIETLEQLTQASKKVYLHSVKSEIAQIIRAFRQAGLSLSDRNIVRGQRLVAAATILAGREEVSKQDLWPLPYLLSTKEDQLQGTSILTSFREETNKYNGAQ